MIKLNEKFEYWIENFGDVTRLCFGCYYPDNVDDNDYAIMDLKKAEYLRDSLNLGEYKKIIVFSETLFGNSKMPLGTYLSKNKLPENMRSLLEEEYTNGKDKTKIHIVEINSDKSEEIVRYGCLLMMLPKNEFNNEIALKVFNECKSYDYKFFSSNNYHELFETLLNACKGCHMFINNFGTTDVRIFNKLPKFVGTVYTYSIYGELVNKIIPEKYCQPK